MGLTIIIVIVISNMRDIGCTIFEDVDRFSGMGGYHDFIVNRQALCIPAQDYTFPLLLAESPFYAEISPDDQYWVMWVYEDDYPFLTHVYSYHLLDQTLIYLGAHPTYVQVRVERWLDGNGVFLYSGNMREWSEKRYLYANLATSDSLRDVIDGRAEYLEEPPRYFYATSDSLIARRYGSRSNGIPCIITEFLLDTAETHEYRVADDCYDVYPPYSRGERDYLVILEAESTGFDEYGNPSIDILESLTFDPTTDEP